MQFVTDLLGNPLFTAACSALAFFAGLLLGHRLELGRERRKEFNEAALPLRMALLDERNAPSPYWRGLDAAGCEVLLSHLRRSQRKRWHQAQRDHQQAAQAVLCQDEVGQAMYRDATDIVAAIDRMLPLTKLR